MYLPNTEGEHWAISDTTFVPIPLYWKSSQLLMCSSLCSKEYLSLSWRVDTGRGEKSRSPKDIVSQAELNMPGLAKNNLTEYLSFFTFAVAQTICLGSHDTLESVSLAVRSVPRAPSFARRLDLLLLPAPHMCP